MFEFEHNSGIKKASCSGTFCELILNEVNTIMKRNRIFLINSLFN